MRARLCNAEKRFPVNKRIRSIHIEREILPQLATQWQGLMLKIISNEGQL